MAKEKKVMTKEELEAEMERFNKQVEDYEILSDAAGVAAAFGTVQDMEKFQCLKKASEAGMDLKEVSKAYDAIANEQEKAKKDAEILSLENKVDAFIASLGLDDGPSEEYLEVKAEEESLAKELAFAAGELLDGLAEVIDNFIHQDDSSK